jgi:hypothetical protein
MRRIPAILKDGKSTTQMGNNSSSYVVEHNALAVSTYVKGAIFDLTCMKYKFKMCAS